MVLKAVMEDKKYYMIGTAGHVDHGKTALVGALTGMDTDRLAEEKKRGLSIELGFAYMAAASRQSPAGEDRLRDNVIAFIDVPGHERFIRSMLSGVSSIDLALFCVAADDGVMPQTREHLDILHLLGLSRAIIVITKTDLATSERIAEVRADVEDLLKGTTLEGSPVAEVSVLKNKGIEELKEQLTDVLAGLPTPGVGGAMRLPVDRVFSIKGYGAVVTGTIVSGQLKVGDELSLYTDKGLADARLRVRGIESHNSKVDSVARGQRAAVNLSGLSHHDIPRGAVLVSADTSVLEDGSAQTEGRFGAASGGFPQGAAVTKLDCVVEIPPSIEYTIKDRRRLKLYHLASERNVAFQLGGKGHLKSGVDPTDKARVYGRLHLDRPLFALRGDRFILRDPSIKRTIAGGEVLMPYPDALLTPRLGELDLATLAKGEVEPVVTAMARKWGYGLSRFAIASILDMRAEEFSAFIEASDGLTFFKDNVVVVEDMERVESAVLSALGTHHAEKPNEPGERPENLRAVIRKTIGHGTSMAILDGLLEDGLIELMTEKGLLNRDGSFIALPSHCVALSGVDKKLDSVLMGLFGSDMKSVLSADINCLSFDKADIERRLGNILERGDAVKLKMGVYIGGAALATARERLERHIKEKGSIRVADMRDLLGSGRRLAIEILEYFDKERITLRKGDERVLR